MSGSGPHAAYRERRVLVMGLGSYGGGLGAARYFAELGADVTVTDLREAEELTESLAGLADLDVRVVLGRHDEENFRRADLVVANPAVAPEHALLAAARAAGARVTAEIELALEALPGRLVAVTGTQGKSSTCSILANLLAGAGERVHLGGNIGGSLLGQVEHVRPDDVLVLELSSYQLAALRPFAGGAGEASADPRRRAEAVGLTNLLSDHLERHGDVASYHAAKLRILELLRDGGTAVWCGAGAAGPRLERAERAASEARARVLARGARVLEPGRDLRIEDGEFRLGSERLGRVDDMPLAAEFQRANALTALGLARSLGVPAARLEQALPGARVPEHRLQDLGQVAGQRVWDNAVSTTPDSTVAALAAVPETCVLLVGGQAKRGLDYEPLARLASERCRGVVAFGAAGPELQARFRAAGLDAHRADTVEQAVARAYGLMQPGDALLFSPACASFDAYPGFLARARAFRAALPSTPPAASAPRHSSAPGSTP